MKKYIIVAVIVVLLGILFYSTKKAPVANANPIKIGAIISLSGPAAAFGEHAKNGILLAQDEINKKGGVNGRKVEVIIEDDHTDPKQAVSAYQKLVSIDKVDGIVGLLWDFVAQPVLPLAEKDKITVISTSNPRIPGTFEPGANSFAMLSDFGKIIERMTPLLSASTTKKIGIVRFESGFSKNIAENMQAIAKNANKGAVQEETYNSIGNNDFKTIVTKLKAANIDTVFLDMVANDPVQFLTRARQLGYTPKTVIAETAALEASRAEKTDKTLFEGVHILNWEITSPAFEKLYRDRYGVIPEKSADKAASAIELLAEAIAKTDSREAVAPYIASHSFETLNGTVKFTEGHAAETTLVKVQKIVGGTLVDVQ